MPLIEDRRLCLVTAGLMGVCRLIGAAEVSSSGPAVVDDASLPTAAFAIETFQTDEGLPQNSINALLQSKDGYLWMGTYSGLVRFDGVRFKVFDTSTSPEMRDGRVTSLLEAADGTLWLGHETGILTRYREGSFENVDLGPNWPKRSVVGISEEAGGGIWVLDSLGNVARVADGKLLPPLGATETTPAGLPSICRDIAGKVWINYRGVAGVVGSAGLTPVEFNDPSGTPYIGELVPSGDGGLWVITATRLRKWREGEWVSDLGPSPWGSSFVTSAMETADGRLVVGTLDQGLYIIQPGRQVSHLSRENGLPHEWVRSLCEDHEGNLWVGTSGAGLCVLRKAKVAMVSPPDQWLGRSVMSVTAGHDGSLWAGTEGAGLYQLNQSEWLHYGAEEGLSNPFVWSVLEDRARTLRVGTWGEGLFIKRDSGFTVAPGWDGLQIPVTAMHEARDGTIWVGTGHGLLRLEGTNILWVYGNVEALSPDVRTITEDQAGIVWFGTASRGLGRIKAGVVEMFTTQDGLASDSILDLCADTDGTLWIGTLDNGLSRLRHGRFRTINTDLGLANNVIGCVADDGFGHLWLSSQQGILRVGKAELHQVSDGQASRVNCLVYGKRQGLATLACSAGFNPSWCRTTGGRLVFPTARGLAVVDPREVEPNEQPPNVKVEEVYVEGTLAAPLPPSSAAANREAGTAPTESSDSNWLEMAPGERRLEILYTALSFLAPEKVLFRYKLAPLEEEWVEAGTRRSANYSFVPPGDYTFHVIACNNDGVWNHEGAQLSIRVLPQFWQTWPFRIATGCFAVATVAGLVFLDSRQRLRRKLERFERERAVEQERSRIAQDIHDDLGASLTRILMLTQDGGGGTEGEESIADNIREVHATARELTRAMDEIVWAVNPKHDTLDSLVNYLCRYAQSFLSSAHLSCRLDAPLDLPARTVRADVRHNLFLAVKEALNNIVKHAEATKVRVSISLVPTELRLELRDNGRGFTEETGEDLGLAGEDPDRVASGFGFRNMRHRLAALGGSCKVHSVPGEGTTILFGIPLNILSAQKTPAPSM